MNCLNIAGPACTAQWEEQQVRAVNGRPLTVLTLPDAANSQRAANRLPPLYYCLPKTPQLVRDEAGNPVFSLTLLLSRAPTPADVTIYDLVERGALACDLTLALPAEVVNELMGDESRAYQPLFAREAHFGFVLGDAADPASEVVVSGANARAGLSISLDRTSALDVLAALQGTPGAISISCQLTYRCAACDHAVRLTGSWADVYDVLASRVPSSGENAGEIDYASLQDFFGQLLAQGILHANLAGSAGDQPLPADLNLASLFTGFMRLASVVLERTTPALGFTDPANRYRVRSRPNEWLRLDLQQSLPDSGQRIALLSAPLEAVLGGALDGLAVERFVHLVSPAPGNGALGAAPRQVRTLPPPRHMRGLAERGLQLAALGGSVQSLPLALRPDSTVKPSAQALLASDLVQVSAANQPGIAHWATDNVVLQRLPDHWWIEPPNPPELLRLPIVADPAAPLWPDRVQGGLYWFAPIYNVVTPAPNADPATSPFLFTLRQSGHDSTGRPGLDGTITFTLQPGMGADTQAALQAAGNPEAHPVPVNGLSVGLELPFRDETGATRSQRFSADLQPLDGGVVRATIKLIDDWVRLCYGALAFANFQTQPPRVSVAYLYDAYVPVPVRLPPIIDGIKLAETPVIRTPGQAMALSRQSYLDATSLSYHLPVGEMRFVREAVGNESLATAASSPDTVLAGVPARGVSNVALLERPPVLTSHATLATATAATPAVATAAVTLAPAASHLVFVAHPGLEASSVWQGVLRRVNYVQRTLGRDSTTDILFPCNTLGAFYIQDRGDSQVTIGCQDAFQLGQTTYRQYELIADADLQNPLYRIYRSLQQPGRFLLVPVAYRITRYAASEGDLAYRPAILLYSTLDPTTPANNQAVIMATLEPDLPAYVRRDLQTRLAAHSHTPLLDEVTQIESQLAYTWAVSAAAQVQPQAAKLWDSFQISLSTDLDNTPQLQAMLQHSAVSGNVTFTLPDGAQLQSALILDLGGIIGPRATGPVEVALQANQASLTNRIERPVNVSDLMLYDASGVSQAAPVDRTLAPGEAVTIPLPLAAVEAYPVYTIPVGDPATLEEIRSFVEDIHTNVVFLNLVNYANHGLQTLAIQAQIKGVAGVYPVATSEAEPISAIDLVLPLTTYLTHRVLQFQVTKTDSAGQVSNTPWLEWPLDTQGNVVSITWDLIG